MAPRRFGPLVVSVLAVTAILILRLAQVQVGSQHEVWAGQASALVRVGRVVPYRRGELRARDGRVLVRDIESYRAVFAYRDFRREHPLGQVAHALGAIEKRCVSLTEAWERMDETALALVELTPAELDAFARGEALEQGPLSAPALTAGTREQRAARRSDLAFYTSRLLGLEGREPGRLAKLLRSGSDARALSYVQLAARVRRDERGASPDEVRRGIRARLAASQDDLEHLAQLLAAQESEEPPRPGQGARAWLIERLEGWRATVEDGAAGDLFAEACGFEAGRVEPATLVAHVDLGWIGALLRWEPARIEAWLRRERAGWLEHLGLQGDSAEAYLLPRLLVEVELAPVESDRTELVLEAWTQPFLAPAEASRRASLLAWLAGEAAPRARPLAVFAELDDLFVVRVARSGRPSHEELFSFQDRPRLEAGAQDSCEVLARSELWFPSAGSEELARLEAAVSARAADWRLWRADHEAGDRVGAVRAALEQATLERWAHWEESFQARLEERLAELAREAGGRLHLAEGRLDRATERTRFTLRDHGGRTAVVTRSPDYELVHVLTRRPESFAGFQVERTHERVREVHALPGQPPRAPLVQSFLGSVRTPRLRDLYLRREERRRFGELRREGRRTPGQQRELEQLAGRVWRTDEQYGSDGLEGYLNPELAGRNGYREERGLQQEVERGGRTTDVAPVDGLPVALTLDVDLQLAALDVLARPRADPFEPEKTDHAWLARPTGAIVLLSVEGEALALASWPDSARGQAERADDMALERTLRLYDSQPPGSVMKPFVAAWALDHLGLDPALTADCRDVTHHGRAGYKSVHCNIPTGHGAAVDLHEALRRSCNTYFAWLGDTQYEPSSWLEMYAAFGFGQPSGLRSFGQRSGLREDGWRAATQPNEPTLAHTRTRMLACNGLAAPQTTVVQVARAFAGLATGRLPDVRLLRAVDGDRVAPRSRPVGIGRPALDRVRRALIACANDTGWPAGSAARALNAGELGFQVAAKTGSADLHRADAGGDSRVLKHTWLAAFFPPERPRYVLVVFCYKTRATSSHSSVWIAQQYLQHPTVRAWLARQEIAQ